MTLTKYDLLQSAASKMPSEAAFGSHSSSSNTAEQEKRGAAKKDMGASTKKRKGVHTGGDVDLGDSDAAVRIIQTDDQKALVKKKLKIAQVQAIESRELTIERLMPLLEAATQELADFKGDTASFLYRVKHKNKVRLESEISKLTGVPIEEVDVKPNERPELTNEKPEDGSELTNEKQVDGSEATDDTPEDFDLGNDDDSDADDDDDENVLSEHDDSDDESDNDDDENILRETHDSDDDIEEDMEQSAGNFASEI
jgi:hypothetical protein